MTYYLIAEKDQYRICLVKEKDTSSFTRKCSGRILVHGCNILEMLCLFNGELMERYAFSGN